MNKVLTKTNRAQLRYLKQGKNLPALLSVRELAIYLHKSIRWVHLERSAGRLPSSVKCGKSRFWFANDVVLWLELNCPDGKQFSKLKQGKGVMPAKHLS